METTIRPGAAWDSVAPAWEVYAAQVDQHKAAATAAMIERLGVRPGDRVLELAAGPGSLGRTWSALVGSSGTVLVSDVSPAMVDVARRATAADDNVVAQVLDVADIDLPDGEYDVVASRMGLMFAPDPGAALREMRRVLAPGGRMAALTWAGPEHNPWVTCVGVGAMVAGLVSGPPAGPGSIFSLGDPAHLARLATDAGFTDVTVEEVPVLFRASDVDAHVTAVSSLSGPLAAAIAGASAEQLATVRRTAADVTRQYVTDDGVEIPGRALLLSGRR